MCIQQLSVDEIAKIFFHKKKYVKHNYFFIVLRNHHGISSFSCIHGKRRPSGNENGHRQSKQWLCWDHSMSLESFVSHKLNKKICVSLLYFWKFSDITKAYLSFLKSVRSWPGNKYKKWKEEPILLMRLGTGNQSNGYVGTTLYLSSLLMTETASFLRILLKQNTALLSYVRVLVC